MALSGLGARRLVPPSSRCLHLLYMNPIEELLTRIEADLASIKEALYGLQRGLRRVHSSIVWESDMSPEHEQERVDAQCDQDGDPHV